MLLFPKEKKLMEFWDVEVEVGRKQTEKPAVFHATVSLTLIRSLLCTSTVEIKKGGMETFLV